MNRDTWTTRDYPVLLAAADRLEETRGKPFQLRTLAERLLVLDEANIAHAVRSLSPTYLAISDNQSLRRDASLTITGLTDQGRRAAGLWPVEESHTAVLVAAIRAAADEVDEEDERNRLHKAAEALGKGAGRVLEGAISAVIAGAVGGQLG